MVFLFVEFPRPRDLWIPAFAGMTEYGVTDDGVDSCLRRIIASIVSLGDTPGSILVLQYPWTVPRAARFGD